MDSIIPDFIKNHEAAILKSWLATQGRDRGTLKRLVSDIELQRHSKSFLAAFQVSSQSGVLNDVEDASWNPTREALTDISRDQSKMGASPSEIATFVFSLKETIFSQLQEETKGNPALFARELLNISAILDDLGLFTTDVALKSREETISRQQTEMLELSTPVVKLWDGILALPLIGTLDSERTQVVMENLLQEIVRTGAGIAIIDITGVPTVDTLVAQHLLKTVAAARLMGAECVISGIRPQIAATIVHLGVDLGGVVTKATLADAFAVALRRNRLAVVSVKGAQQASLE